MRVSFNLLIEGWSSQMTAYAEM